MSIGPETLVNHVQLQMVVKKNRKRDIYKCCRNLVLNENIYRSCP